ncbi:Fc.00g114260.m01.CDS01 [Cosmosporella sp. VM-42]
MPSSTGGDRPLNVEIDLEDRRIIITFRTERQARHYNEYIKRKDQHGAVQSKVKGCDASIRLPTRVTRIVASTNCRGFYIVFNDAAFAKWWEDNLIIWKAVKGSKTKIYVDRDMKDSVINARLGIEDAAPSAYPVPPGAVVSAASKWTD